MKHRGPLLDEYNANPRKYKWPDPKIKLFFPKIVSDKWRSFLIKYIYPEDKVKTICNQFFSQGKVLNYINFRKLYLICLLYVIL